MHFFLRSCDRLLKSYTTRKALNTLADDGVIEVPNFMNLDDAVELRRTVNMIYAVLSDAYGMGDFCFLCYSDLNLHFSNWHGVFLQQMPLYLEASHPALARSWSKVAEVVVEQVKKKFGSEWRFLPERSWLRRHVGIGNRVPWHIDADAAAVSGFGANAFNVWLPLDRVGEDAPSLEVVPRSHKAMRHLPLLSEPNLYRGDAFVTSIGQSVTPVLGLGDALVFDQYTLHRTQLVGNGQTVRTACEFRFCSVAQRNTRCTSASLHQAT